MSIESASSLSSKKDNSISIKSITKRGRQKRKKERKKERKGVCVRERERELVRRIVGETHYLR